mmetsp:Transcript_22667/g.48094  ORF Transcript_22667/g.48094 Transcript_22667/m.48094 type:complete len:292 (+) Transcript_22667:549-1424(+)
MEEGPPPGLRSFQKQGELQRLPVDSFAQAFPLITKQWRDLDGRRIPSRPRGRVAELRASLEQHAAVERVEQLTRSVRAVRGGARRVLDRSKLVGPLHLQHLHALRLWKVVEDKELQLDAVVRSGGDGRAFWRDGGDLLRSDVQRHSTQVVRDEATEEGEGEVVDADVCGSVQQAAILVARLRQLAADLGVLHHLWRAVGHGHHAHGLVCVQLGHRLRRAVRLAHCAEAHERGVRHMAQQVVNAELEDAPHAVARKLIEDARLHHAGVASAVPVGRHRQLAGRGEHQLALLG